MQAMIFAAGLGTRLKPLTDTMPKALVKVGGEPLLGRVIMNLKNAGFDRIVVNVHHFAGQIIDYLSVNRSTFGLDICISDESDRLLDTGGGLKKAAHFFRASEPVLIHNVDILSNINLRTFYDKGRDACATLLVSPRETKRYLLFAQDGSCRLKGWTNIGTGEIRSPYPDVVGGCRKDYSMYAFSGIHVISPKMFQYMDGMPDKFGIMDFYLKYCAVCPVCGYVKENLRLMDVGKLDTLDQAERFIATI